MKFILFARERYWPSERIIRSLKLRWPNLKSFITNQAKVGYAFIELEEPDLAMLYEDSDGPSVRNTIKSIREFSDIPIIVFGKYEEVKTAEMIKALDAGADDYIVDFDDIAVFSPILAARIAALMRRIHASTAKNNAYISSVISANRDRPTLRSGPFLLFASSSLSLTRLSIAISGKSLCSFLTLSAIAINSGVKYSTSPASMEIGNAASNFFGNFDREGKNKR